MTTPPRHPKNREDAAAARKDALIRRARENPNEFFNFEECGIILGFGINAMRRLNAAGAPVAFRKMNPRLVCEWIAANPLLVAKSGEEDGNS